MSGFDLQRILNLSMPAPQPTRVGLLNTGELVLVDSTDRAQVLSAATTRLIAQELERAAAYADVEPSKLLDGWSFTPAAALNPGPGTGGA